MICAGVIEHVVSLCLTVSYDGGGDAHIILRQEMICR